MHEIAQPTNELIANQTKELLAAFKFAHSKRGGFQSVMSLAQKAELFSTMTDNGKTFYLAGFGRSPAQALICHAFMEEIRTSCPIKYLLFAGGKLQKNKAKISNMLDCAAECTNSSQPESFCLDEYDSPARHFAKDGSSEFTNSILDESVEPETWVLPCKLLAGFISLSSSELEDPITQIRLAAEKRLLCACPHFNADRFSIREKPKEVPRSKRYW